MPPLRTMPTIKPTKTERSHEENQERAYIAASRRSDRSLEARVESARRASEIHEKRTGRKLRVTEQDVINEEMYEEEDDNIPWRYRHLALLPNLSTLSPEFRRRVEAQLVLEMERSRMVDPNGQFQSPGPYLNPGLMQMPHAGQQNPMLPPSMFQFGQHTPALSPQTPSYPMLSPGLPQQQQARSPSALRTSPYPTADGQQRRVRPSPHQRSASIAAPQHQYTPTQTPGEQPPMDDRRMSLPPQNNKAQRTQSPSNPTPPVMSRTSSSHTQTSPRSHKSQSQAPSPSIQGQPQFQPPNSYGNNPYAPLTTALPINTQQLLGDGMFSTMNQPMYNYNPNGKQTHSKKRKFDEATTSSGLEQTLMPTALDTSVSEPGKNPYFNAPFSADPNYLNSAFTDPGYGFGFDNDEFGLDMFKSSQSSGGHPSPAEFNTFVHDDLFSDQQFAF